jgi:hypothetical protein
MPTKIVHNRQTGSLTQLGEAHSKRVRNTTQKDLEGSFITLHEFGRALG